MAFKGIGEQSGSKVYLFLLVIDNIFVIIEKSISNRVFYNKYNYEFNKTFSSSLAFGAGSTFTMIN